MFTRYTRWCYGVAVLVILLSGCRKKNEQLEAHRFRVGVLLNRSGKDDRSFNASAVEGATRAQKELGIELILITNNDDSFENAMNSLAQPSVNHPACDLIIAVSAAEVDALKKVAPLYPKIPFAIIDAEVSLPNVTSLVFAEQEGSYLVGYLAGLKSRSKTIGFIGGMDIPTIRKFSLGYETGANRANSQIRIIKSFVGIDGTAWENPGKGKELALAQIEQGADIIFAAAGKSGLGVLDAVEEVSAFEKSHNTGKKVYAIGVDSNQNGIKPGLILTSMVKRVDKAVYETIKEAKEGRLHGGIRVLDLKNGGLDYSVDEYNRSLITKEDQKKLEEIRERILDKSISVPLPK